MTREELIAVLNDNNIKYEEKTITKNRVNLDGFVLLLDEDSASGPAMHPVVYPDLVDSYESLTKFITSYQRQSFSEEDILGNIDDKLYLCLQRKSDEDLIKYDVSGIPSDTEVYLCLVMSDKNASVKVTKELFNRIDLSREEAFDIALRNVKKDSKITNMCAEITGDESLDDGRMYILKNKSGFRGASAILNTELIKEFMSDHKFSKIVCIPSSIHEFIVMEYTGDADMDFIKNLVSDINGDSSVIKPEDILGYEPLVISYEDLI